MSDWVKTTLGEVLNLAISTVQVVPDKRYDIVGVLNRGRGLLHRDSILGAETSYKTLNRIKPNQVVYSRLKAFEGAITVASARLPIVYASQEFPTFDCGPLLLPSFFRLLTTTQRMWDALQNLSTGMGGRRERVKPGDFLTMPISLPTIAEQHRIVEVMAAVDAQIKALEVESKEIWTAWRALVTNLDNCDNTLLLGLGLRAIQAGKSPKGQERVPAHDERAVLKISAVGRARFDPTEVKTVAADTVLPETTKVCRGDVLLVRCNAVLDRVGTVCQVHDVPENLYLCDKTLRLVTNDDVVLPNYLAHAMATPSVREQIAKRTAGSDMRNIGQGAIRELTIPNPGLDAQRVLSRALDGLVAVAVAAEAQVATLRVFRSALLSSLLSQEVEIPTSYDAALAAEMVVAS